MEGIVLAAGRGSRLRGEGRGLPKGLLPLAGEQPLRLTLSSLHSAGVGPVTVVVGYRGDAVRRAIGQWSPSGPTLCVANRDYAHSDTAASFAMGAGAASGPVVVAYADTMFMPAVIERLLSSPFEDAVVVDPRRATVADMGVRMRDDRVARIAKHLPQGDIDAESIGLFKLSAATRAALIRRFRRTSCAHDKRWLETVIDDALDQTRLAAVTCGSDEWCEIDEPADVERATAFAGRLAPLLLGVAG